MATTVTAKGRVTVPKKVRDYLGIRPGSTVVFVLTASGDVILNSVDSGAVRRSSACPSSRFARLRGSATVRMRREEVLALTRGG
jgi:AbrB family looped-hinge helix DNA binding protein